MKNSVGGSIKYVQQTPQRKKMIDLTIDDLNFQVGIMKTQTPLEYQNHTLTYATPFIKEKVREKEINVGKYKYFSLIMGKTKFIACINLVTNGDMEYTLEFLKHQGDEYYNNNDQDFKEHMDASLIEIDGKTYSVYVYPDKRRLGVKKKRK